MIFTQNLLRHVQAPTLEVKGGTVREALRAYFVEYPQVQSYILDDQGEVRKHVTIFLNGDMISDRVTQTDVVTVSDEVFVAQALSGG
ncbi:MAG: MoaD/ThiS family protein [Planctomycetota bacterium]